MQRILCSFVVSMACTPLVAQYSDPAFEVPMVVLHTNQDSMIEVLDNDGDGDQEALAVRIAIGSSSSFAAVRLRDLSPATLSWVAPSVIGTYVTNYGTMQPSSDVGQVGTPDIRQEAVVAIGSQVWVIANYSVISNWSGGTVILDVAIGDYDGDGDGDVLVLTELGTGVRVLRFLKWTGAGLVNGWSHTLPPDAGTHLMAADVTGDGVDDGIVVGSSVQAASWAPSGWTLVHNIPVGVADPMPVVGDIDNDGDADIVVFGHIGYVVLRRAGPGTFSVEAPVVGGPATHLHDLDGDGDLDGACCSSGGGGVLTALTNPMTYHISINDNGTFLPAYKMHGVGGYHLAGVTDVDGNGFPDLVAGRTIFYSRQSLAIPPAVSFTTTGSEPAVAFDADGDGDVDLMSDASQWLRNRGDGTFDPAALTLLTPPPGGMSYQLPVVVGDFDGDGDSDLIVNVHDNTGPVATRLLLQRGDAYADGGVPLPAGQILNPQAPGDLVRFVVADLDQDSDLDLVLNEPAPTIGATLLFNNGTGQFAATPLWNFTVKAVADFTNDGLVDLLVCDGRLLMRRGIPGGGWQATENLTLTGFPHFHHSYASHPHGEPVLVADWDQDGIMDVVARENYPSATPTAYNAILISTGGATPPFTHDYLPASATGGWSQLPSEFAAADIDADGNLDCILGNAGYGGEPSIVILFGTGNPLLFDTSRTENLMMPFSTFADVDADGDADALRANVVFGNRVTAPAAGHRLQWSAGSIGAGGRTPLLGVAGVVAAGHAIDVRASGLQGQTFGLLALDVTTWSVPMFGGTSHVPPTVTVGWAANGVAGLFGDGNASFALPLSVNLAGLTFHLQGAFLDSAVGISLSNPVTITIGP